MGKRGAEDQLTKDDVEGGRGGRDDSDDENNVAKDAPKEVIAARQIRGIPKRKIAGAASVATPSFGFGQPSATAPTSAFGAPVSSGFSFGSAASASTSSFGAPKSATPSAFGAAPQSTSSAPVAFGATATTTPSSTTAPSSKPFSGFNFGGSAATTTPASTSTTSTTAPGPLFGSTANTAKPTSSETSSASKTPFSGFSFGAPAAPAKVDTPASTATSTPAAAPKTSAFAAFGQPSAAATTSAFGAKSAPVELSKAVEPPKAVNVSASTVASSQPSAPKEDEKEIEYLTSLRGLNESAVRALSVKIRDDPFINLASALESLKAEYDTYLQEITKKAGKSLPSANGAQTQTKKRDATAMDEDTSTMEPPHKMAPDAKKSSVTMPAPPPSMPSAGGFKLPTPSSSIPSSTASGFKPVLPGSQSDSAKPALPAVGGFTLPVASSSSTPQSGASTGFKPTLPSSENAAAKPSPFAGFSFGQTVEKKDAAPTAAPASAGVSSVPFPTFGAAASNTGGNAADSAEKRPSSRASLFAQAVIDEQNKEKTAEKETPATPSAGQKQSSIFAIKPTVKPAIADSMVVPSPSSTGASSFLFKAPSTPSAAASTTPSKLPTFSFNMGSSSDLPPSKSLTGFNFAPKPRTSSASFGFGFGKTDSPEKSGDANGNAEAATTTPVSKPIASGFSFGADVPRTTPKSSFPPPSSTPTGNMSRPAFSFGPTATSFSASKPAAPTADSAATDTGSEEAPADAGPQADLTVGAGEEDEETLWQGKVSIGSFGKFGAEGAAPTWGDWKLCILKLNKEKNPSSGEQPMRRFLARIDPSGTIVQNFSLRSLSDMSMLTSSAYRMTVAGADGIKQVAIRFGKKKEGFDPAPMMVKLKTAIQTERTEMGLPSLPSLK